MITVLHIFSGIGGLSAGPESTRRQTTKPVVQILDAPDTEGPN